MRVKLFDWATGALVPEYNRSTCTEQGGWRLSGRGLFLSVYPDFAWKRGTKCIEPSLSGTVYFVPYER